MLLCKNGIVTERLQEYKEQICDKLECMLGQYLLAKRSSGIRTKLVSLTP